MFSYKKISIIIVIIATYNLQGIKRPSGFLKNIVAKKTASQHFSINQPKTLIAAPCSRSSQGFTGLSVALGMSLGFGLAYQENQLHADDSSDVAPELISKDSTDKKEVPLTYALFVKSPHKKKLIEAFIDATPTADILYKNSSIFDFIDNYLFSNNIQERNASLINHLNSVLAHHFDHFSVLEKIDKTSKTRLDKVLYRLIQTQEDEANLISLARKNIYLASEITILANLLYDRLACDNEDKDFIHEVGQSILDNYTTLEKTEFGPLLMSICLEKDSLLREQFVKTIEHSITQTSPFSIALASKYSPCNPIIKAYLEQQNNNNENKIVQSMKMLAYVDHCKEECALLEKIPNTRTLNHIQKEINAIEPERPFFRTKLQLHPALVPHYLFHQWHHYFSLYDFSIQHMIEDIINKETTLKSDYYTFFHGQRSSYLPYIQLHTFLQQTINENNNVQHLMLHISEHPDQENIKKEKKLRNNLLNNGSTSGKDSKRLLFTNWAFFANASSYNFGASSAHYVTHNTNASDRIALTIEKVFIINNIHHLFTKYKNKIEKLLQDFEEINQYGTCMLLAIPKASINKHIYLGNPYGEKTKTSIEGFGETDDISLIMKTLESEPKKIKNTDRMEFCIPMTYDKKGALNPQSGIKIFAFTPANPSALDAWYTQMYNVFDEIAADIKQLKS